VDGNDKGSEKVDGFRGLKEHLLDWNDLKKKYPDSGLDEK
jgi:hypothetical protein